MSESEVEKTEEEIVHTGNTETPPEHTLPRVMVAPHELGGIKLTARDLDGNLVHARLGLQEAAMLVSHLSALVSMLWQSYYAQVALQEREAQENAQKLYVPRS